MVPVGSNVIGSDTITDGIRLTACGLSTREQREQSFFHPESSHCKIQQDATPATYLSRRRFPVPTIRWEVQREPRRPTKTILSLNSLTDTAKHYRASCRRI